MLIAPIVHLEQIDRAEANRLLVRWGHRMGPMTRPVYAFEAAHVMCHHGDPVAIAVAGETAREVVGNTGLRRDEVVELVRLCAERPHLCRPMLRLWREFVFPPLAAAHRRRIAVSYADTALHSGDVYRFDGWHLIGKGGGGGTDARTGRRGRKMKIWAWPPEPAEAPWADRGETR